MQNVPMLGSNEEYSRFKTGAGQRIETVVNIQQTAALMGVITVLIMAVVDADTAPDWAVKLVVSMLQVSIAVVIIAAFFRIWM